VPSYFFIRLKVKYITCDRIIWHENCSKVRQTSNARVTMKSTIKLARVSILWSIAMVSGCENLSTNLSSFSSTNDMRATKNEALKTTGSLFAEQKSAVETSRILSATGFASVSVQPSKSINQRRLLAMRAAKLDAYRTLTEQIHGLRLQGETTIGESVVTSDRLAAAVQGLIIGAEVNQIKATSSDTYQVELSVSEVHLRRIISNYGRGI